MDNMNELINKDVNISLYNASSSTDKVSYRMTSSLKLAKLSQVTATERQGDRNIGGLWCCVEPLSLWHKSFLSALPSFSIFLGVGMISTTVLYQTAPEH